MAKAKYLVVNCEEMLPAGKFTAVKTASEFAESLGNEADVITSAEDIAKFYKSKEILRLHNSVMTPETALKRLGKVAEAAELAFSAMLAFDYENGTPEPKEGVAKKPGRQKATAKLDTAIISIRHDGFATLTSESVRRKIWDALAEFQGEKSSVALKDFRESLPEELRIKAAPALRYLAKHQHVDITIEEDGDLVAWIGINEKAKQAAEVRAAKKAEKEAAKKAAAKKQKAKKKAEAEKEEEAEE